MRRFEWCWPAFLALVGWSIAPELLGAAALSPEPAAHGAAQESPAAGEKTAAAGQKKAVAAPQAAPPARARESAAGPAGKSEGPRQQKAPGTPAAAAPPPLAPPRDAAAQQAAAAVAKVLQAVGLLPAQAGDAVHPAGATGAAVANPASSSEDGGEEAGEPKKKRKKKPPDPPMFRMRDGTRIAGLAEFESLSMHTAYGPLRVPVGDLVRIRFGEPRDPQLEERIEALVEELGSDEFDLREEATEALRVIGIPALEALRQAASSEDQEVKTRAEKLVAEVEEELEELEENRRPHLVPLRGEEDEVVTVKFTAMGRVELPRFTVKTSYGDLSLHRDDILSIVFRLPPFRRHTVQVGGANAYAGNNKWVGTGLQLTHGATLKITATGNLHLNNYGVSCNPDGTTATPASGLESFAVGALVGRIGAKGKPFLIGTEHEGVANASGELALGISFKSGSTRGQFQVEIEVELEEAE